MGFITTCGARLRSLLRNTVRYSQVERDLDRKLTVHRERVLLVTPHAFGETAAVSATERLRRYERLREAAGRVPGASHAAVSFPTPLSPDTLR